jgi:peptidoglycan/xylan/chitin deacetylase (PgdA/CDA1 family)
MVHRTPFILPLLYPSLIWRIPTDSKQLYLTFDDGPVPGPTEFVLDTLRKFNVNATFFCIGDNIQKHPYVFQQIIRAGHKIGNHTHNHLNGWKTERNRYVQNVDECEKQIAEHSPLDSLPAPGFAEALREGEQARTPTTIFRPPYGRITRDQIRGLNRFKIIMWDVLAVDYNQRLSSTRCLRNTINASRPGSITVFHDSLKAEKNLTFALPRYIEHFLELGFEFKVIPG